MVSQGADHALTVSNANECDMRRSANKTIRSAIDNSGSALFQSLGNELMAVHLRAGNGYEQGSALHLTGINGDVGNLYVLCPLYIKGLDDG